MQKTFELIPAYFEEIPNDDLHEGILYISEHYSTTMHLCCCGCGKKVVCALEPHWQDGWTLTKNFEGFVTLRPSIGNWTGQNPYHVHYYITNNKIEWLT